MKPGRYFGFVILLIAAMAALAYSGPGLLAADAVFTRSLWVGEEKTVIAVSLSDGQPGLYISTKNLEDIAVDNTRGVVWVGTKKEIIQYKQDGTENFRHPIKHRFRVQADSALENKSTNADSSTNCDDDSSDIDIVRISLDPYDGSVWIGAGSEVIKLSFDNRELFKVAGFNQVTAVSVDMADSTCWVAEPHKITKYGSDGAALFTITIEDYIFITALAADPVNHTLWVGTDQGLGRIDALGQELFRTAEPVGIRDMEVNPRTGSLWLVTGNAAYKYGNNNQQLLRIPLCPDSNQSATSIKATGEKTTSGTTNKTTTQTTTCGAEFIAITTDVLDNTVWAATKNTLYKGNDAGEVLLTVPGFIQIQALDIGLPKPGIKITEPLNGAEFETSPIIVRGIITDPTATVEVNGIKATTTNLDFEAKNIILTSGTNTITATATNLARQKATDTIQVTYKKPDNGPSLLLCPEPYGEQRPHPPTAGCAQQVMLGDSNWNRGYVLGRVEDTAETVVVDGITLIPGGSIYNQGRILSGNWTGTFFWAQLLLPGADGTYPISATVTNEQGNTATGTVTFIKDSIPPNVFITAPANGTITNTQNITLTGTVDDPTATLRLDETGANIPIVNGTFTTQYDMGQTDGPKTVYVTATDPAGNQGNAYVTINKDATPPQITITTPADGAMTNGQTITIAGTITDQNPGTVAVAVNTGPAIPLTATGTSFSGTATITNGINTLQYTAIDRAGNTSTHARSITLDQEPPTATVTGITPNAVLIGTATITVTATDILSGIQSVTLLVDGIVKTTLIQGPYTFNLDSFGLTAGNHTITIRVLDRAGNMTEQSFPVTVQGQLSMQITEPISGTIINKSKAIIKGKVNQNAGMETGVVINGVITHVQGNDFAAIIPLQAGQNIITATATDINGLTAEVSIIITSNPQQQAIELSIVPDSGVPATKANGTTSFDTTMSVSTSATTTATYAYDTNGDGSPDQSGVNLTQITASYQTPGLYFPTVTVTDTMGNTYTETAIVNVLDRNAVDALLKAKWEGMKAGLAGGNVDTALSYFIPGVRERYKNTFTLLQSTISTIAANMQTIELIYVTERIAKYRIRRDQVYNGQTETITYYIYFSKNAKGIWQIEQF
jgi:hypothetical protein